MRKLFLPLLVLTSIGCGSSLANSMDGYPFQTKLDAETTTTMFVRWTATCTPPTPSADWRILPVSDSTLPAYTACAYARKGGPEVVIAMVVPSRGETAKDRIESFFPQRPEEVITHSQTGRKLLAEFDSDVFFFTWSARPKGATTPTVEGVVYLRKIADRPDLMLLVTGTGAYGQDPIYASVASVLVMTDVKIH